MLTQAQLDKIIRQTKGQHAVEALLSDESTEQVYRLDNGATLTISKEDGTVQILPKQ